MALQEDPVNGHIEWPNHISYEKTSLETKTEKPPSLSDSGCFGWVLLTAGKS